MLGFRAALNVWGLETPSRPRSSAARHDWTAAGFLQNAIAPRNPLAGVWTSFAGSPVIDLLNMWGLALTGLGLILGVLVRRNAFSGAIMMLFYWAAAL